MEEEQLLPRPDEEGSGLNPISISQGLGLWPAFPCELAGLEGLCLQVPGCRLRCRFEQYLRDQAAGQELVKIPSVSQGLLPNLISLEGLPLGKTLNSFASGSLRQACSSSRNELIRGKMAFCDHQSALAVSLSGMNPEANVMEPGFASWKLFMEKVWAGG